MSIRSATFFLSAVCHHQPTIPFFTPTRFSGLSATVSTVVRIPSCPARAIRSVTTSSSSATTHLSQTAAGSPIFPRTALLGYNRASLTWQFSSRSPWQHDASPPRTPSTNGNLLSHFPMKPFTTFGTPSHATLSTPLIRTGSNAPCVDPMDPLPVSNEEIQEETSQDNAHIRPLPPYSHSNALDATPSESNTTPLVSVAPCSIKQSLDPPTPWYLLMTLRITQDTIPNTTMLDTSFIESVANMARRGRTHFARLLSILSRLLCEQERGMEFKVSLIGTELRVFMPCDLFRPHSPSYDRIRDWLGQIGIDPCDPLVEIRHIPNSRDSSSIQASQGDLETTEGKEDTFTHIDTTYFQDIQSFLDHVDDLIGKSAGFPHRRNSQ